MLFLQIFECNDNVISLDSEPASCPQLQETEHKPEQHGQDPGEDAGRPGKTAERPAGGTPESHQPAGAKQ